MWTKNENSTQNIAGPARHCVELPGISPNCSSPIWSRPGSLNHRRHSRCYPGFGLPLGTEPALHGLALLNFATATAECYPESVSDVQPAAHTPREANRTTKSTVKA